MLLFVFNAILQFDLAGNLNGRSIPTPVIKSTIRMIEEFDLILIHGMFQLCYFKEATDSTKFKDSGVTVTVELEHRVLTILYTVPI